MQKTNFGEQLRGEREKADKRLGQLAKALGVSVAYLSDVERGNRSPLTNDRILAAAEFLGLDDPSALLKAAAEEHGTFDLDASSATATAMEVGAALTRSWRDLTDEQLRRIKSIVTEGKKVEP